MDEPDIKTLLDMGFSRTKAEKALSATGNNGVASALDWLLAHPEDLVDNEVELSIASSISAEQSGTSEEVQNTEGEVGKDPPAEAKSIQCKECNKLFRTTLEVEYHASKTGHNNFAESTEEKKPLTEEEKKEQLRLLETKMKEKRKEREEKEKQETLEREKNRIRTGKEIAAAKKKLEDAEMKKIIEQRKREKEEDRLARQRVKEQIEADKLARKEKFSINKEPISQPSETVTSNIQRVQTSPANYTETRLQIRLTNGKTLIQTFKAKEQLSAVRLYVEMNRNDGEDPFTFMTNFPKKIYENDDYEKPLQALGLVPSAVLIVVKART